MQRRFFTCFSCPATGVFHFFARGKEVVQYLEKAEEWPEHESEEEPPTAK